jgi:2-aminoadipate transaminase
VETIHDIAEEVLTREKRGIQALQYGNPMGVADLRQAVIDRLLAPKGLNAGLENLLIVSGGIESMNLVTQLISNRVMWCCGSAHFCAGCADISAI